MERHSSDEKTNLEKEKKGQDKHKEGKEKRKREVKREINKRV